ncbi:MAG: PTS sugar transporter subunit IIA [Candidatus Omnitrophica bacterium]|nr:PTS sugar transporter subunit IIA [Candidatus Omnitrophota bacterium]
MSIKDFLKTVSSDLQGSTKEEIISELVGLLIKSGEIKKTQKVKVTEVLMAREALGSTAIGQGIAIPHGKTDCVDNLIGCLGVSKKGVDFDSLDGEPAYIFFLLIAPVDSAGPHLKALARISRLLKDKFVRDNLKAVKDDKDMLKLVQQEDGRLLKL